MELDGIEEAVNGMSDKDGAWWPFLWLRPQKSEMFSLPRIAALSVLYGLPLSVLTALALVIFGASSAQELFLALVSLPLQLFLVGSVAVAPMWNRRAHRLRRRHVA